MKQAKPIGEVATRGRFEGVWNILRFNWPFYVVGGGVCVAGGALLVWLPLPFWLRLVGWVGIGLAFFWLLASLLVSFYVYDVSPLYRWGWLKSLVRKSPQSWVNIHSGLDESSLALRGLFPDAQWRVLDMYDAHGMTEPAIERARALVAPPVEATPVHFAELPLADETVDAVFLLFAAHEIREPEARLKFFRELKRIAMPGATVVLVEHLRDAANFVAFGPGFWHFLPRREWQRLARKSGFALERRFRITPFVMVFVLKNLDG